MSDYIPFEESPEAMHLLRSGFSLSVRVMIDREYEDRHRKNYLKMLGYDKELNYMTATILSEIGNMPGHYVVVGNQGSIVTGLHGDIFFVDPASF